MSWYLRIRWRRVTVKPLAGEQSFQISLPPQPAPNPYQPLTIIPRKGRLIYGQSGLCSEMVLFDTIEPRGKIEVSPIPGPKSSGSSRADLGHSEAPSVTSTSTWRPSRTTLTNARSPGFFCSTKVSISSTVRTRLPSIPTIMSA